jgi:hypothetical protein
MENLPSTPNPLSQASVVSQIIAGANITIDEPSGVVTISAPGAGPGGGVLTLAGLEGVITLSSPDDTININVDGQDIGLTSAGIITASAGTGISITGTTSITIGNEGVTSLTDGTRSSTGIVTLSAGTGMEIINGSPAGTFTFTNAGVTELTGGDGIGLDVQTGSVTVSNLGVLSASPGAGIDVVTDAGAVTISNRGVRTLADLSGAVLVSAGTGIGVVTNTGTNTITISNTGITALTPGTGIGVSGSTINNRGVLTIADLSGAITLSATGMTITPLGQNIDFTVTAGNVSSVNSQTGAVLIEAGDGIAITNTETPSINIANSGVLTVVAGTGISLSGDTPQNPTINVVARTYTLLGATTGGVITYSKASGSGNTWTSSTWTLMNTIQINVPPGWVAGQSVGFDGYEYINWDSNTTSYYTIYYVTPSQATEQSLIGDRTAGFTDAIYGNNAGQAYLPMNLTIPPTYLASAGTITIRVYGYVTAALHYMVDDPLIDARVNIAYP